MQNKTSKNVKTVQDNAEAMPTGSCSPVVAICYDFDKTLSPEDMQNYSLIPALECTIDDFWKESNTFAKNNHMDKILSYMKLILVKAKEKDMSLSRKSFNDLGKAIELFSGVEDWFDRINEYAKNLGITVEHYIISAGIKEILEGTSIAKYFKHIYASEFYYEENKPVWPCQVVNYTTKTQYLFRISKNCTDLSDENTVNEHIDHNKKRIPFSHFIYIGDSETDIPAMKIVKTHGGTSIGVYKEGLDSIDRVRKLINQNRIDFLLPANYSEGKLLEKVVENTIAKISKEVELSSIEQEYQDFMQELDGMDKIEESVKSYISICNDTPLIKNKEQDYKEFRKFIIRAKLNIRELRDTLPAKYPSMPVLDAQNYAKGKVSEIKELGDECFKK